MKIGMLGLALNPGKLKYSDERLAKLTEKYSSKKVSPYFFELVADDLVAAEAIAVSADKKCDLFIQDMEKVESRLARVSDEKEKQVLEKCLQSLEKEIPLCDVQFEEAELKTVRELAPLSFKPTLIVQEALPENKLLEMILKKSGAIFFYTAGPKESKAWLVKENSEVVYCAGKIHSDLARGFIKAEIVNYADFMTVHNMQEAKAKGMVKLVDRDYLVQDGDMLDIKFNV